MHIKIRNRYTPSRGRKFERAFLQSYNLDLQGFLSQTPPGNYILKHYNKEKKLDRKTRNFVLIIVKEAIHDSGKVGIREQYAFSLSLLFLTLQ